MLPTPSFRGAVDIQSSGGFRQNSPRNQDNPLGRISAFQASNGEWLYGVI